MYSCWKLSSEDGYSEVMKGGHAVLLWHQGIRFIFCWPFSGNSRWLCEKILLRSDQLIWETKNYAVFKAWVTLQYFYKVVLQYFFPPMTGTIKMDEKYFLYYNLFHSCLLVERCFTALQCNKVILNHSCTFEMHSSKVHPWISFSRQEYSVRI